LPEGHVARCHHYPHARKYLKPRTDVNQNPEYWKKLNSVLKKSNREYEEGEEKRILEHWDKHQDSQSGTCLVRPEILSK
jgi:hypothetical protein